MWPWDTATLVILGIILLRLALLVVNCHSKHFMIHVGVYCKVSIVSRNNISTGMLIFCAGESCYSGHGRGYGGSISVTESGEECQVWTSDTLHQHLLALDSYPELAGDHNYCRNPGERGERPWCFTTNRQVRWEYCDVPQCGKDCKIPSTRRFPRNELSNLIPRRISRVYVAAVPKTGIDG